LAELQEAHAFSRPPVLFHAHGLGEHDFSAMTGEQLAGVEAAAAERGVCVVPTVFLRREWLPELESVITRYAAEREQLPHILGFAMEGPLLGPQGGTPRLASWHPTQEEWATIARLGRLGLRYVVLAPDALELDDRLMVSGLRLRDLVRDLYANGVKIALGHFLHDAPELSAARVGRLLDFVHEIAGEEQCNVLTDHLFNDMPRSFRHVWRGEPAERRDREAAEFLRSPWEPDTLPELLGPVPAALLKAAREGLLMPCMNFDGQHVDLAICRRTVDYLGAENLIAISDHIELTNMAGESLTRMAGTTLWLRDDGVVAAGSTGMDKQIQNMRSIGLSDEELEALLCDNPRRALASHAHVDA
jgi:N-acetylglucosamine-6-phosphate deacetylase